jgi:hypothetical protein
MKPGWKTSEFWLTVLTGLPALLVAAGLIPTGDQSEVSGYISKILTGLFATVALARYIHSRAIVKSAGAILLFIFLPSLAPAQCLLPWRQSINQQLQTINQRLLALENAARQPQPAPQPQIIQQPVPTPAPQLYVLGSPVPYGPLQQIPLGGPPLQNIPLGGPPQQQIPLGGPPLQNIPLGGPPQQQIPLGNPPQQQIPLGQQPPQGQQIPLGTQPAPGTVPTPTPAPQPRPNTAYQRYTVIPCLYVKETPWNTYSPGPSTPAVMPAWQASR